MIWRFGSRQMTFEKIRIMGILNVTPDSFSDGGKFFSIQKAVEKALEMEKSGADLIDIGGESTRPGAESVSLSQELDRILPVIREIRKHSQIPISIDTTKPEVAHLALKERADIINDVDGLRAAGEMSEVVKEFGAGFILMHRRGTPETMQTLTQYTDVVEDVFEELDRSLQKVMEQGIDSDQIVLDPGIGFAKTAEQNLELIARLSQFRAWGRPILSGPSRKSFIGNLTGKTAAHRDWGSAAAVVLSIANGAHMVRVHEVEGMRDVAKVAEAIVGASSRSPVRLFQR